MEIQQYYNLARTIQLDSFHVFKWFNELIFSSVILSSNGYLLIPRVSNMTIRNQNSLELSPPTSC